MEADDVIGTLAVRAAAQGMDDDRRDRRPRLVPARARPAPQGPLQQARRLGLRALRRGRHPRTHRRHAAAVRATTPRCAATRATTCPASPASARRPRRSSSTPTANLEGIFEHLDELPPKQTHEPRRVPRTRSSTTARCRSCAPTWSSTYEPDDLRMGGWDHEVVRVLFEHARVPARSTRACSRRSARRARRSRRAETLDADGPGRCASAEEIVTHLRRGLPRTGERYVDRAPLGRTTRVRRAARTASRSATSAEDAVYVHVDDLRDAAVRPKLDEAARRRTVRRSSRTGPKELMHGLSDALDVDVRTLDLDTAVMAYLLDPGERKYDLEQLALRFLELELTSPDREEGTLDLDGDAAPGGDRSARRSPSCAWPTRSPTALEQARAHRALRDGSSGRSCACWRRWRTRASAWTASSSTSCGPTCRRQCDDLERQDPHARGRAVRRELGAAAAPDPVREARADAGEADQDRPVDRRRLARRRWPPRTRTRSSTTSCGTARSRSSAAPTPTRSRR